MIIKPSRAFLEILDPSARLETVLDVLIDETYISKLEREIEAKAKAESTKTSRFTFSASKSAP